MSTCVRRAMLCLSVALSEALLSPLSTRVPHGTAGRWRGTNCEPLHLCWTSGIIFVSGLICFWLFQYIGEKLIERNNRVEEETAAAAGDPEKGRSLKATAPEDAVVDPAHAMLVLNEPTAQSA